VSTVLEQGHGGSASASWALLCLQEAQLRANPPVQNLGATSICSKHCLSHRSALTIASELIATANKAWRQRSGDNLLPQVIEGVRFRNGILVILIDQFAAV